MYKICLKGAFCCPVPRINSIYNIINYPAISSKAEPKIIDPNRAK